jgi:hypothetical protein
MTVLAARVVESTDIADASGQWLLMGILVLAIFGGGVFFLRRISRILPPSA